MKPRHLSDHLPQYDVTMHLEHNKHKVYYETVEQACDGDTFGYADDCWVSEEQKREAIETDDCWIIQWYPNTPIGFHILTAHDLGVLLDAAREDT